MTGSKRLGKGLVLTAIACVTAMTVDVSRVPEQQFSSSAAVSVIETYQKHVSRCVPCISCRYEESCSRYCKRAFKERGFLGGIIASTVRVQSCF